jgi:hypothetical protein
MSHEPRLSHAPSHRKVPAMDGYLPFALLTIGVLAGALVSGFAGFHVFRRGGRVPVEAVPLMTACRMTVQAMSLAIVSNSGRSDLVPAGDARHPVCGEIALVV